MTDLAERTDQVKVTIHKPPHEIIDDSSSGRLLFLSVFRKLGGGISTQESLELDPADGSVYRVTRTFDGSQQEPVGDGISVAKQVGINEGLFGIEGSHLSNPGDTHTLSFSRLSQPVYRN